MRKGWTKFNNVLMYISMVGGFITVISLSFYGKKYWWAVVLIGLIVVLAFHAVWGMLIEMSKNILKLGSDNKLANDSQNDVQEWTCPVCMAKNSSSNNFCDKCGNPKNDN